MSESGRPSGGEDRFADAPIAAVSGFVLALDEAGNLLHLSPDLAALVGPKFRGSQRIALFDSIAPEDRSRARAALTHAFAGQESHLELSLVVGSKQLPVLCRATRGTHAGKGCVLATLTKPSMPVAAGMATSDRPHQELFDAIGDALIIHGFDGRVVEVNDATCRMFGCARNSIVGQNAPHLDLGEAPYSQCEALEKVRLAVTEGPQLFEWRSRRVSGEPFWSEISLQVAGVGGQARLVASVRDITRRKRARDAARANARRLELAFTATADAIWEWDFESRALFVSPRWYEMLGYADGELEMNIEAWKSLCHPDDQAPVQQQLAWAARDTIGIHRELELRMKRKDGSWARILWRGSVTARRADGAAALFGGTHTDITKQREAELEAAHWKRCHDALAQAANEVVYSRSADGTFTWSGDTNELLGYGPSQLRGELVQWESLIHPEDRARVTAHLAQCSTGRLPFLAEYRLLREGGDYVLIRDSGYPHLDDRGTLLGYVGTMADVLARRRRDLERQRSEEQYRQLERLESIGRLAGGVAHGFNNLLTAISGNLSLAEAQEGLSAELRGLLREASVAADTAAVLTRRLLMFSKRQLVEPRVLMLNDALRGWTTRLGELLGERIRLVTDLANALPSVRVDEEQLEQVLIQLSLNARDALPNGGELKLETSSVSLDDADCRGKAGLTPGDYVLLAVSDNGVGMSHETRRHALEPFYTTKALGAGLGLAMTHGAVRQNGGYVEVHSELDEGTMIRIYLPAAERPRQSARAVGASPLAVGAESVMVVEDEESVRSFAVRVLIRQGYRVQGYSNAEEALAALARAGAGVDLLLTDVVMPGMNGRELAEQALRLKPELKVLLTSGYANDAVVDRGELDSELQFIAKPYSVSELAQRVRCLLDSRRGADARGGSP